MNNVYDDPKYQQGREGAKGGVGPACSATTRTRRHSLCHSAAAPLRGADTRCVCCAETKKTSRRFSEPGAKPAPRTRLIFQESSRPAKRQRCSSTARLRRKRVSWPSSAGGKNGFVRWQRWGRRFACRRLLSRLSLDNQKLLGRRIACPTSDPTSRNLCGSRRNKDVVVQAVEPVLSLVFAVGRAELCACINSPANAICLDLIARQPHEAPVE